jgi:geranylgeranyl pyrophosphate synthase
MKEKSSYSYPLALAFEIFQTAILVHDDIIDNDDLRRDKITIHAYNYKKYYDLTKSEKSKKLSDNIAICMGDLGLYNANQVIANNYRNDSNLGNILSYFNEIVINTIKGEMLDVILPFKEEFNLDKNDLEESIMEIYKLKTAYYTIIGPLSLGMILGNAKENELKDIEKFGYNVGIAFQLQDDMLGIYGKNIGKKVGSDIEEFKQTILYAYTKNTEYYNELLKIYGNQITDEDVLKVQEIFKNSGAYDYTLNKTETLYNNSLEILDNITWMKEEDKQILKYFVMYLKNRKK